MKANNQNQRHNGRERGRGTPSPNTGHNGAGHNAAGHNGAGHNAAGHNGAGHNAAGHNAAGHNGAGHNGAGHNGAGHNGDNEKRRNLRTAFDVKIGVSSQHRIFVGLMSNISSGGLFLSTEKDLQRGDKVEVRFQIPGSDHVFNKHAEVCWTRPYDLNAEDATVRSGAGVRLIDLSDEEKRVLNAFIAVHEPIFFEN